MQKIVFLLFVLFACLPSYGQQDSLQNEILRYKDLQSEVITNGRKLLLDKFKEDDFPKVGEIRDHLVATAGRDYLAFYPVEYLLLSYWTYDYDKLIASITGIDSMVQYYSRQKKVSPQPDLLFDKVLAKTIESMIGLETSIGLSNMEAIEKDILSLNLKYLVVRQGDNPILTQDDLNKLANNFLDKYPASRYESYVRDYIRQEYVPAKWALTAEFFSGYGWLTGNLAEKFENSVPIGVAFDIYYKKVVLYIRDYIGFSHTKLDIPYNGGTWEQGSQVRLYLPELTLGYVAFEKKRLKVAPFAGLSWTDFSATEYDINKQPGLEEAGFSFTTTYSFGISLDIKFGRTALMPRSAGGQSYGFVRLRYTYNSPQFSDKYDNATGRIHSLTIGVGGFSRKTTRIP